MYPKEGNLMSAKNKNRKQQAPGKAAQSSAKETRNVTAGSKAKKILNKIFIDGLSGMATGLFATLIIGTIIGTIGGYIPAPFGTYVTLVGKMCQCLMGAGIGLGVAIKFKESPLVTISAAVCGMIGSYAKVFTAAAPLLQEGKVLLPSPGEPLGASSQPLSESHLDTLWQARPRLTSS